MHSEGTSTASRDTQSQPILDTDRIVEHRPATAAQEGASTEQKVSSTEEELSTESLESDRKSHELKDAVRGILRKVPSSVAVITVESVDPDTKKPVPMGVAVSSLTSVTLDPPTISFNIKQPSKTLDAIRAANGCFRVHFPGANRGGVDVVELFCRGNHSDAYDQRSKDLKLFFPLHRKEATTTASLAPQIRNNSICAAMECTLTHEFPVADHVIIAARVDSLEQKTSKGPTIVYVDGTYMRSDTTIALHGKPNTSAQSEGSWPVWDYPLFPGEQERKDYMKYIKTVIKDNPAYRDKPIKEAYRDLVLSLPYYASNFGINDFNLLAAYRQKAGSIDQVLSTSESMPALSDFYGRLSPPARAKIMKRAKRLVREDSRFLSLNYKEFLQHLGVDPGSRDLLPSEIMNSLRAEGLVGQFEPTKGGRGPRTYTHYDIEKLEQVEHQLCDYFGTIKPEVAQGLRLETVLEEELGEDMSAAYFFKRCRSSLLAKSHPEYYDASKIDIRGEVSREEARVVLSRIITFLQIRNLRVFRTQSTVSPYEVLRVNGVHPTITGMDIEYLFAKINGLFFTLPFPDFVEAIDKILEPWFDNMINWDDLGSRVKQFVQKTPLRATSWSNRDKLAAMGLNWEAVVQVPSQNTQRTEQPLNKGPLLETLVAKELKNYYGNGTEEENRAIARYLKKMYNFDVHSKPVAHAPQDSENRSSSDDMQEAMMASLNVDVLNGKRAEEGAATPRRARTLYKQKTGGGTQETTFRKHYSSPRKQPVEERREEKRTGGGWTNYSLDGGKK